MIIQIFDVFLSTLLFEMHVHMCMHTHAHTHEEYQQGNVLCTLFTAFAFCLLCPAHLCMGAKLYPQYHLQQQCSLLSNIMHLANSVGGTSG